MAAKLQQNLVAFGGRILLAVFLVLSLALITLYFRESTDGPLHSLQSAVSGMSAPFKFVGGAIGSGGDAVGGALEEASTSEETLESLRSQNEELRDQISQLEEYRQEALRLEGLLGLKDNYDLDTVGARVISRNLSAGEQVITIDKGSNDGVVTGLPVMGPSGVIGQVISTSFFSSDVRLLTDPLSGVAVLIQSNRAEGIVSGSLDGLLYLEYVSADVEVQVGDVVVTSGLGGSYFRGLTVGMVVKVEESQGGSSRKIIVKPNESTGPLEEVIVVRAIGTEGDAASGAAGETHENEDQTESS